MGIFLSQFAKFTFFYLGYTCIASTPTKGRYQVSWQKQERVRQLVFTGALRHG